MSTVTVIPASNTTLSMLRVAAYCRVSSNSADQIHSYQAQITTYTNLIASHQGGALYLAYLCDAGGCAALVWDVPVCVLMKYR